MKMDNRFRSGGIGELEIVSMDLYPNRWDFVKHNRGFRRVVIHGEYAQFSQSADTITHDRQAK
jgi:hypothetical protein